MGENCDCYSTKNDRQGTVDIKERRCKIIQFTREVCDNEMGGHYYKDGYGDSDYTPDEHKINGYGPYGDPEYGDKNYGEAQEKPGYPKGGSYGGYGGYGGDMSYGDDKGYGGDDKGYGGDDKGYGGDMAYGDDNGYGGDNKGYGGDNSYGDDMSYDKGYGDDTSYDKGY